MICAARERCPTTFPNPNALGASFSAVRWGLNMETPSEELLINGLYGAMYSMGLQNGDDPRFLQGVATLKKKHFDAKTLEGTWGPNGTITRATDNAIIGPYDWGLGVHVHDAVCGECHQGRRHGGDVLVQSKWPPAAHRLIFNAINGVPSCANNFLLQTTLRDAWGYSSPPLYSEHRTPMYTSSSTPISRLHSPQV